MKTMINRSGFANGESCWWKRGLLWNHFEGHCTTSLGELKIIKNQDIVKFITSIEEKIEDATENYKRLIESWDDNLLIRQHQYIRWMSIAAKGSEWFQVEWPKSLFDTNYEGFFSDPILENMYIITVYDQTLAVQKEQALIEYMKSTLSLVVKQLEYLED